METKFVFQKPRRTFGRQCLFSDHHSVLCHIDSDHDYFRENYVFRNPADRALQKTPQMSADEVNTEGKKYVQRGMLHAEGGWAEGINPTDPEQTIRYKRKVEKDDLYAKQVTGLVTTMEHLVLQNNAVNVFEEYFEELEGVRSPEEQSVRIVNLYRDRSTWTVGRKTPVVHLSWSTDGGTQFASARSDYGRNTERVAASYVWAVENPNVPLATLHAHSQTLCLEFNPKEPHELIGGMMSGEVAVWDVRDSRRPVAITEREATHQDRCNSVLWINSKTGSEFFSGGSDGQVMWWDTRMLAAPTETLLVDPVRTEEPVASRAYGVSVLDYETTMSTRFLVGTEQGVLFTGNRKGKTQIERLDPGKGMQCHSGPIRSISRNQAYMKALLTVGDYTWRIWYEDFSQHAVIWSNFHREKVLGGAWSPTRCTTHYTCRSDGVLDVWDTLQAHDKPVLSFRVTDHPMKCIRAKEDGKLIACGNDNGSVYLVEVSDFLTSCSKAEKEVFIQMVNLEYAREKEISNRVKEKQLKMKTQAVQETESEMERIDEEKREHVERIRQQTEAEYFELVDKERKRQRKGYFGTDEDEAEGSEGSDGDLEEGSEDDQDDS